MTLEQIAKRIRRRRSSLRLSQQALADRIGCSRVQVTLLEGAKNGTPMEKVPGLCKALEITPNQLFGIEKL